MGPRMHEDSIRLTVAWATNRPERTGHRIRLPDLCEIAVARLETSEDEDGPPSGVLSDLGVAAGQLRRTPNRLEYVAPSGRGVQPVPGTVVSLGGVLLYCTESCSAPSRRTHRFGEPDAYGLVGESPAIQRLRERITFAAARDHHVLITGPSGTGKELVAQGIHRASRRGSRTMVARNVATLPTELVDAEVFGNIRNYPNPGTPDRPGLVGQAHGSTLFLDEIGEVPASVQSHFLRLLDRGGEYQRLGDARVLRSDMRVIAATNRRIGDLKPDLAARFKLRLTTPGLDERRDDIPLLVRHFLRRIAQEDPDLAERFCSEVKRSPEPRVAMELMQALLRHEYPLHVRDLEAILWTALGSSDGPIIGLTDEVRTLLCGAPGAGREAPPDRAEVEAVLKECGGIKDRAWRRLGLKNRFALYRLMLNLGVSADDEVEAPPSIH